MFREDTSPARRSTGTFAGIIASRRYTTRHVRRSLLLLLRATYASYAQWRNAFLHSRLGSRATPFFRGVQSRRFRPTRCRAPRTVARTAGSRFPSWACDRRRERTRRARGASRPPGRRRRARSGRRRENDRFRFRCERGGGRGVGRCRVRRRASPNATGTNADRSGSSCRRAREARRKTCRSRHHPRLRLRRKLFEKSLLVFARRRRRRPRTRRETHRAASRASRRERRSPRRRRRKKI